MVFVRRTLLLALALALPVVMTGILYVGTVFALQATNRTIDPDVLRYSAYAEYAIFLLLAIFEARNRW